MQAFQTKHGGIVIRNLVKTIQENAAYLSELDGATGDGDHGINMSKGFGLALERVGAQANLSSALDVLGNLLLSEIGGAMGPLYGTFFIEMAAVCRGKETIDAPTFAAMLNAGHLGVQDLGNAQVGDKTLIDTLAPADTSYAAALAEGATFANALGRMAQAAEAGKESTRMLVAKIGRASRLGERSRGHLDAGAASCFLILDSLATTMITLLDE